MLLKYPLDSFRYYLLRAIPAQNDGRFSEKELIVNRKNLVDKRIKEIRFSPSFIKIK